MRLQPLNVSLPSALLLLLPALTSAVTFDCQHVRVEGQSFDFGELRGPHSVHLIEETPPSISNTTFTLDICNPLLRTKGVPKEDECPSGTRVCAIEQDYNPADNSSTIRRVIPIAGEYAISNGRSLDPSLTRLKNSASHGDNKKEGVRVELNGGRYPFDKSGGRQQKAIIEFLCSPERTGLEGAEGDSRDKVKEGAKVRSVTRAEDGKDDKDNKDGKDGKDTKEGDKDGEKDGKKDGDKTPEKDEPSLKFISYELEGEGKNQYEVLRLEWQTKYACEGQSDKTPSSGKSSHWGFFTWFIIILFMLIATYLIFGSWLNYNRYGARGWDLVPHGDSIRDLPYAVKDWGKSIVSTVQGGGSRGGYSAV